MEDIVLAVESAGRNFRQATELDLYRRRAWQHYSGEEIIGQSGAMRQVRALIEKVVRSKATSVLITGESGTGKELVARAIHYRSDRAQAPLMEVNCSSFQETLLENELFGHEKGAYTDATDTKKGLVELCDGGTLFLDEVAEMPLELQAKLLRVLETSAVLRVGASDVVPVDVRVIAATNRDAARAVREGKLREDLYYRLNVFPIAMPPLRDRLQDVELLADHFLGRINHRDGSTKRWSPEAMVKLLAHHWPGNVRELKNAVERAAILADSIIGPDLVAVSGGRTRTAAAAQGAVLHVQVGSSLDEVERRLILATLAELNGDKRRTAETLGIGLKTLYTRLSVYEAAGHGVGQPGTPTD